MGKHTLNRLSAKAVDSFKERGYYADGGGLHFRVSEFATKSWAFRYTRAGKAREMGLGPYPDVGLKEARERAAKARELLRDGGDPIAEKRAARSAAIVASEAAVTFEKCAAAFIAAKEPAWKNAKSSAQWRASLEAYAYPVIGGGMLARDVEQAHILKILEPIWTTKTETAARVRARVENILDFAIVHGYRKGPNPARWKGHLDKILPPPDKVAKVEHHAALPYAEVGAFMADLRKQAGMGARALELAILTAARSGEVRGATWGEFDLAAATWTIPAGRMKAEKEHRIPLSAPAVKLLSALPRMEGTDLVFPSSRGTRLSDMTLTAVLKRMGRPVTAHGFRSTFRDWGGETSAFPREVIEHALAHQLKDRAEAAYARGTLFDKRRLLMAAWAKYCGTVASAASVTPINRVA